ncbi:MAG: NYN domain-containing protein [Chloroflexi bacterium]|nr:NYN domain-containing protein [Chloroflexota bacterium]
MDHRPPVGIMPVERLAIFIDGWNFKYATYDSFGIKIDYIKFLEYLAHNSILLRAYYYTGEWDDAAISHYIRLTSPFDPETRKRELEESRDADRRFLRFLDRNGYKVIRKPVRVFKDADGEVRIKADLDLEIAIDMLTLSDRCEKQILVSGDSDFVPLVNAVAGRGVRVVVVSTQHEDAFRNAHYRASDQLLDAADEFISIESIRDFISR